MIEGIIFDLDGVITDTAIHHYHSWKKIAAGFGLELSHAMNEQLKGVSRKESLDKIAGWANVSLTEQEKVQLLEEKNTHYLQLIAGLSATDILPGITDFLEGMKSQGLRAAVGSSSKNAIFILEKLHLLNDFQEIVDGNMVKNTKPDPEVFLNAAQLLGLTPQQCVVIEDAPAGVIAGKRAGMKVVGIGSPRMLPEANICLDTLEDVSVRSLLKQLDAVIK
jgi:beta-phosphoglucomutase